MHAKEIGVPSDRDWTVTGGMPFAGGPFNSYVLQSTGTMAERLRALPSGAVGLVSSVSGLLTKQGVGVWCTGPGGGAFGFADVTEEVAREEVPRPVVTGGSGPATVVGCTVVYAGEARRGVAVLDLADGVRTMAGTDDGALIEELETVECVGRRAQATEGVFRLV